LLARFQSYANRTNSNQRRANGISEELLDHQARPGPNLINPIRAPQCERRRNDRVVQFSHPCDSSLANASIGME
jgi:hypothetical protein